MKRFLKSRLIFIAAAFLMTAAAIALPLSGNILRSHAAGISEGHSPSHPPQVKMKTNSVTGKLDPVVTIMQQCPATAPINPTGFNAGDLVNVTATFTSPDPNEGNEPEETNNALAVFDTNVNIAPVFVKLNQSKSFSFTATSGDQLKACFVIYDSDEVGTITYTATPQKHQVLFVLLQGQNTKLDVGQTQIPDFYNSVRVGPRGAFRIPGIAPFLKSNGYANAQFLSYSYKGSATNGDPLAYRCLITFTQHISQDANLLGQQINAALTHNPVLMGKPTDIYLIGHSLGGAVAYAYLTALLKAPTVVPLLPSSNDFLKGVVTLDSPVGGVSSNPKFEHFTFDTVFKEGAVGGGCKGLTTFDQMVSVFDLAKLFDTTSMHTFPPPDDGRPNDNQGAHASDLKLLGGTALTNQELAEIAATMGTPTHVLTIGNNNDFLYNPSACHLAIGAPAVNFKTSQWIEDEAGTDDAGDIPGVYARQFTAGTGICESAAIFYAVNHFEVYNNTAVEKALVQFLAGSVPNALNPAPPNP